MPVSLRIDIPTAKLTSDKTQTKRVMRQAGQEVARAARSLIRSTASPSAPGGPPGSRTGLLASSIRVSVRSRGDAITARVSDSASRNGVFYSRFLETGALGGGGGRKSKTIGREHKRGGAKGTAQTKRIMEPRPYLTRALEDRQDSLSDRIRGAILDGIQFQKVK